MAKYAREDIVCCITGAPNAEFHHVKHKGNGGSDEPYNMIPLTHELHQEAHIIGLSRFVEKYPKARKWLVSNNWNLCPVTFRWRHLPFK